MRSRATTGICLSPSRRSSTVRAVIADGDDAATSWLVRPGEVGAIGVGVAADGEALGAPVVAHARRQSARRAKIALHLARQAAQRRRCPRRTRGSTPGCRPACRSRAGARRCARRASGASSAFCSASTRCVVSCLSFDLDDHLRVVQLLQLGRDREPEPRAAAADERRERLQDLRGCRRRRMLLRRTRPRSARIDCLDLRARRRWSPRAARPPAARRRRTTGTTGPSGRTAS